MKRLLAIGVIAVTCSAWAVAQDGDARQLVKMPDPMRQHMLTNMRDHLLAITEIQRALGSGEFQLAADIAEERLGVSSLALHGASQTRAPSVTWPEAISPSHSRRVSMPCENRTCDSFMRERV